MLAAVDLGGRAANPDFGAGVSAPSLKLTKYFARFASSIDER